jgi:hypothetical protein
MSDVKVQVPFGGKTIPGVRFEETKNGLTYDAGGYLVYEKPTLNVPRHEVFLNDYNVGGFWWGPADWKPQEPQFSNLSQWFIDNITGDFAMWQSNHPYGMVWAFEHYEEAMLFRLRWG